MMTIKMCNLQKGRSYNVILSQGSLYSVSKELRARVLEKEKFEIRSCN